MVPAAYSNYFLASTGASAALIGLLFVAISLAPEHTVGTRASAWRHAQATSAFTALLNAFFVSLVALIPNTNLGYTAAVMGAIGIFNTLTLARNVSSEHLSLGNVHRATLLVGSLVLYVWELWFAVELLTRSRDPSSVDGLSYLLLGAYGVGAARAWGLLGLDDEGLFSMFQHVKNRDEPPVATPDGPDQE